MHVLEMNNLHCILGFDNQRVPQSFEGPREKYPHMIAKKVLHGISPQP